MKKIIKILPIFGILALFASCKDDAAPVLSVSQGPAFVTNLPSSIVIDKNTINEGKIDYTFTPVVLSEPVGIASQMEIGLPGENFTPTTTVGGIINGIEGKGQFTYKELNAALTNLGLKPNETTKVEFRIRSYPSSYAAPSIINMVQYSNVLTIDVTPYEPDPSWVYAVGEFQNWNRTGGYSLISVLDNGIYIGYINFPAAESTFLILPDNSDSWDHKWGSSDGATLIKDGGSDIKSPGAGYHKITVDLINLTIQMVPYSWGIIGDATPTDWNSDTDMTWNYETLKWEITIDLKVGEFKIRLNNDWTTDYGITKDVVTKGGGNIPITEDGTYLVTFDEENLVITWAKQ